MSEPLWPNLNELRNILLGKYLRENWNPSPATTSLKAVSKLEPPYEGKTILEQVTEYATSDIVHERIYVPWAMIDEPKIKEAVGQARIIICDIVSAVMTTHGYLPNPVEEYLNFTLGNIILRGVIPERAKCDKEYGEFDLSSLYRLAPILQSPITYLLRILNDKKEEIVEIGNIFDEELKLARQAWEAYQYNLATEDLLNKLSTNLETYDLYVLIPNKEAIVLPSVPRLDLRRKIALHVSSFSKSLIIDGIGNFDNQGFRFQAFLTVEPDGSIRKLEADEFNRSRARDLMDRVIRAITSTSKLDEKLLIHFGSAGKDASSYYTKQRGEIAGALKQFGSPFKLVVEQRHEATGKNGIFSFYSDIPLIVIRKGPSVQNKAS